MKEKQLRNHAECNYCGRKIGECGIPAFFVLESKLYAIDLHATTRQTGLGMQLNPLLAMHMGPDEDLAIEKQKEKTTMCFNCGTELLPERLPMKADAGGSD